MDLQINHSTEPFRHWVIDGMDLPSMEALKDIPEPDWPGWVRYDNDCERGKRTAENIDRPGMRKLFDALEAQTQFIRDLTGIQTLEPTQRCGGIHITDPGGWLNPHLDAALYPNGMERRINLVAFLNDHWTSNYGGELVLLDDECRQYIQAITPRYGRVALWESSDIAYHAVDRTMPFAPSRITAAVYYLAPARPGCVRKRALFAPKRG